MKRSSSCRWWRQPRLLAYRLLLVASVAAGLLVPRSGCADDGKLVVHGLQVLKALPAGEGADGASVAHGLGSGSASGIGEGIGRGAIPSASPGTHDTAVVAFSDGTVYLIDGISGSIYGSFSSGSPLSDSYQSFTEDSTPWSSGLDRDDLQSSSSLNFNRYFISCGDDGHLYEHSVEFGKRRIEMTIEEYVKTTPRISMDGEVTLGSKRSTMFLVDAKTGSIVTCHWPTDAEQVAGPDREEDKTALSNANTREWVKFRQADIPPVIIKRTDYILNHFAKSTSMLWGLTASVIEAYTCQPLKADLSIVTGLKNQANTDQCGTMVHVHRIHGINRVKNELLALQGVASTESPNLPALVASPEIDHINSHKTHNRHTNDFSIFHRVQNPENALDILGREKCSLSMVEQLHNNNSFGENSCPNNMALPVHPQVEERLFPWYLLPLLFILPLLYLVKMGIYDKLDKASNILPKKQLAVTKKKKARRGGKNNGLIVGIVSQTMTVESVNNGSKHDEKDERHQLMSFDRVGEKSEGRRIGQLFLSNTEIAKGSNGTIILEGVYGGRPVAVKRLVRAHHDVAFKEIENLIASDHHPNIIRWFGVEHDSNFIYLLLERCTCSLNDLIGLYSDASASPIDTKSVIQDDNEYEIKLHAMKDIFNKEIKLWKPNGCPSPQLLKLMRDVVSGLAHLHGLGIIHRDIKPQNVLISINRSLSAKLSDMGISKRLPEEMSSLGNHATGCGSTGWRAPEQLLHGRQTRAIDLFSVGCLLFFCMTKGRHPFGNHFERDSNILNNRMDLFLVEQIPEAVHLFSLLLSSDPGMRPKALQVLQHPLFWDSEKRLAFLRDASDRVELEDRETGSELLNTLEGIGLVAFGGKWGDKLDAPFINDMGRYRKYKLDCTRDLLRVMRNKLNHYRELPYNLQELLGSVPEGFDDYFTTRFPKLLIEVYKVMHRYCSEDASLRKYFRSTSS